MTRYAEIKPKTATDILLTVPPLRIMQKSSLIKVMNSFYGQCVAPT